MVKGLGLGGSRPLDPVVGYTRAPPNKVPKIYEKSTFYAFTVGKVTPMTMKLTLGPVPDL